jgi:hypothetical protein
MLTPISLARFSALLLITSLSQPLASQNGAGPAAVEKAVLVETKPLNGRLYHVQGLDLDREHIWITSVDKEAHKGYLHEFDRKTATFEREIEVTDGQRFHPGGISLSGGSIWVPVAEYRPHSTAVIEEIDTRTLTVKRRLSVPDHVGCVAFTGSELIAGNWGSRQFYVLKLSGNVARVFDNPSANQYQDIKFADGMLVASGVLSATSGAIDWYRWPSMKLVRSLRSGMTDTQKMFTNEGMALEGNNLYLVPEDGPSRLFHFVLVSH